ncbi:MAG: phytanoyl-CoA dioxygenase [Polyangiales bacterium]
MSPGPLSASQVAQFVEEGFVRVDDAFEEALARDVRAILWPLTGCNEHDPRTWREPVVRIGERWDPPLLAAANTPRLLAAFDQLVGSGRWQPRRSLGTFVVRFPSDRAPNDDGWHVDASFAGDDPQDYFAYRVNVRSRGRALLMLFLFSDVGDDDAPTRIRVGSHRDVARLLAPAGEAGLAFMELAGKLEVSAGREVRGATGAAGTVYLCHPFLAHAAQAHRGRVPRLLAQPPLLADAPITLTSDAPTPLERSVQEALHEGRA